MGKADLPMPARSHSREAGRRQAQYQTVERTTTQHFRDREVPRG